MNLSGRTRNELLFVNFNQDATCISIGTKHGYKMYNCDPFGKCYGKFEGGTSIVEMLFCTSLVALVGAGETPAFSPRRLQIANTKRQSTICELNYVKTVLGVKMNRKRLIVVLEDRIHIYDITNMKILHTVDTLSNSKGVCALSPNSDNNYLAYPAISNAGEVLIFDALNLQAQSIMQAHKGPVTAMSFNYSGNLLATCSDKGTVIRVFSIPDAKKLYQFRRGTYPATIYSMAFNIDSSMLCVSSSTDTVHLFKMDRPHANVPSILGPSSSSNASSNNSSNPSSSSAAPSKFGLGALSSYLPEMFTEMWDPERHFAHFKLPNAGSNLINICALSSSLPQAMVVTSDGSFYQYNIPVNGGECTLLKQYSILDPSEHKAARVEHNHDNSDPDALPAEAAS